MDVSIILICQLFFSQYHIEKSDFHLFNFWLCVWDRHAKERDNFLGEIKLPLSGIDLNQVMWYGVKNKVLYSSLI